MFNSYVSLPEGMQPRAQVEWIATGRRAMTCIWSAHWNGHPKGWLKEVQSAQNQSSSRFVSHCDYNHCTLVGYFSKHFGRWRIKEVFNTTPYYWLVWYIVPWNTTIKLIGKSLKYCKCFYGKLLNHELNMHKLSINGGFSEKTIMLNKYIIYKSINVYKCGIFQFANSWTTRVTVIPPVIGTISWCPP
jgi:hypothetical protein